MGDDVINEENRRRERRAPFYDYTLESFVFFFLSREKQFLKLGLYTLNKNADDTDTNILHSREETLLHSL